MFKNLLDLQWFAIEPDVDPANADGTENGNDNQENIPDGEHMFTQAELDKIVATRLEREKKINDKLIKEKEEQLKQVEQEKSLALLNEEERKKAEIEIAKKAKDDELMAIKNELATYRQKAATADVIKVYAEDNMPCVDKFAPIARMISKEGSNEEQLETLKMFTDFVTSVQEEVKQASLKQATPTNGIRNVNKGYNPFTDGKNITEISRLIRNDPKKATELAKAAGKYDKYKTSLK